MVVAFRVSDVVGLFGVGDVEVVRHSGSSDGFCRVSDPADPQDADEILLVVDDVRQRDPVGHVMLEEGKSG